MSYTRTFPIALALKGSATSHKIYKLDLIPSDTTLAAPKTAFQWHFANALKVRIVSISGEVIVPFVEKDKAQPFGCAAIVASTNTASTVHELASGSSIVFAGASGRFEFRDGRGVDRSLKGEFRTGGGASLHIGIASSWDSKDVDLIFVTASMVLEFEGESDSALFAAAYDAPT